MKKQMLLALWLPLITIAFLGCKKSVNNLPYEVRSYAGGYQFGATIDGVEYVPNGSLWSQIPAINVSTYLENNGMEIDWYCGTYQYDNNYVRRVVLYVRNFKGIGSIN